MSLLLCTNGFLILDDDDFSTVSNNKVLEVIEESNQNSTKEIKTQLKKSNLLPLKN